MGDHKFSDEDVTKAVMVSLFDIGFGQIVLLVLILLLLVGLSKLPRILTGPRADDLKQMQTVLIGILFLLAILVAWVLHTN